MRIGPASKLLVGLLAAGIVVSVAAFALVRFAPRRVPPGQPPLSILEASSLPAFRDAFNAQSDQVRVLVMLSPT